MDRPEMDSLVGRLEVDSPEMDNEEVDSAPMTFDHPASPSKEQPGMPHRTRASLS
jgi:hypothetical protein